MIATTIMISTNGKLASGETLDRCRRIIRRIHEDLPHNSFHEVGTTFKAGAFGIESATFSAVRYLLLNR